MVMTTCAIRSEVVASRSPKRRNHWSMAMPTTSPGSMSGETMKVASASRPGKRERTTAIAQSVPRSSETAVETSAMITDSRTADRKLSSRSMLPYQRSESPFGGKSKTGDDENDTPVVTTIGGSEKV